MYEEIEFLFKAGDEIICPSCHDMTYIKKDIPATESKKFVHCPICGTMTRFEKWQKQEQEK